MGKREHRTSLLFSARARAGLISALAIALLGLLAVPAAAQSVEELNAQIASAEGEAQQLAATIEARGAELAAASARAQAAAQREAELSTLLSQTRGQVSALDGEVADAERDLATARERLDRATEALADRLVAIYKSGVPDASGILLHADGFDDLVTRAELLDRIQAADQNLVGRVRVLRAEVAAKLGELEQARARAAAHAARIAAARDQVTAARDAAASEAAALVAARERQQAALASLEARVGTWTQQVQRLQQEQAQQTAAAAPTPQGSAQQARQTVASWVGSWAIPRSIVMCESGGNFQALNSSSGAGGAYQIMPSTWRAYGGRGLPHQGSPAEQHRIASQIWRDSGSAAWVC